MFFIENLYDICHSPLPFISRIQCDGVVDTRPNFVDLGLEPRVPSVALDSSGRVVGGAVDSSRPKGIKMRMYIVDVKERYVLCKVEEEKSHDKR